MTTSPHMHMARFWVASALERDSAWRKSKAEEYPDDTRNARAADALLDAARYVRGVPKSKGLDRLQSLVEICVESGIDLTGGTAFNAAFPGPESQRVSTRYFFFDAPEPPDIHSHEELLHDLYNASLRDLSEHVYDVAPESPLGRLLTKANPRPVEPTIQLLTEIRDILRERLLLPDAVKTGAEQPPDTPAPLGHGGLGPESTRNRAAVQRGR